VARCEASGFAVPILGLMGIGYGIGDYTTGYAAEDQAGDIDAAVLCGDVLRRGRSKKSEARSKKRTGLFSAGDDLEAVGDGGEAEFARDFFAELDDLLGGEGDHFTGFQIDEMVVRAGAIDEVIVGLFAAAVGRRRDLVEEAGVAEVLEGAIDGGLRDAVGAFAEFEEEFLGFEGVAEFLDGLEDGGTLGGEFEVARAEEFAEDLLGRG
jgi:hypothetical protein